MSLEARKALEARTRAIAVLQRHGFTVKEAEEFVEALVASR